MGDVISTGLVNSASIGVQESEYKVGDTVKLIFHGYGGISPYFEGQQLSPTDRLIEVEVKTIKKIKVEYIEA